MLLLLLTYFSWPTLCDPMKAAHTGSLSLGSQAGTGWVEDMREGFLYLTQNSLSPHLEF